MDRYIYFILLIIILFFSFSCSSEGTNNEAKPINIKNISLTYVEDRAPRESDFQVEIELAGILGEENINQDIDFSWQIEYLDLDINKENINSNPDNTSDMQFFNNYLAGYYFLEVSKNPINSLLSIYKPGYYKVTFTASNAKETKDKTVILKIGDIEIPELFVKINIPKYNYSNETDYKGKFYLNIENNKNYSIDSDKIIGIKAKDIMDDWYGTGYCINPYLSFNITAGTHLIDTEPAILSSVGNESLEEFDIITYSYKNNEDTVTAPIILKNINNTGAVSINKKGSKPWKDGNLYVSYLSWLNIDNKDQFNYSENIINKDNKHISYNLDNTYLAKIFIGSLGHRVLPNNYFVYFGPDGIDSQELDPKNKRDLPYMPYGYLIGKLGKNGKTFAIGSRYSYSYSNKIEIYSLDNSNNFVREN